MNFEMCLFHSRSYTKSTPQKCCPHPILISSIVCAAAAVSEEKSIRLLGMKVQQVVVSERKKQVLLRQKKSRQHFTNICRKFNLLLTDRTEYTANPKQVINHYFLMWDWIWQNQAGWPKEEIFLSSKFHRAKKTLLIVHELSWSTVRVKHMS